jgi:hypothetical protein
MDSDTGQALDGRDLGKDWPAKWHAIRQQAIRPPEAREKTPPPDPPDIEFSSQVSDMQDGGSLSPAWDPTSWLLGERFWPKNPTPSFGEFGNF